MQGEIGLGTYLLEGQACTRIVEEALEIGYRLIDTASAYGNHEAIGRALSKIDREQVRIVSKIWIETEVDDDAIEKSVRSALNRALNELKIDYIDAYLIHWPRRSRDLEGILCAMHLLKEEGKIRDVGVSNFTQHHLQDAYDAGIEISWNQVELHPMLTQKQLIDFSRKHGTHTMAYRPFGKGLLPNNKPLFAEIGKKHGRTGAQVILRWITQQGITAIPKASSKKHLIENFQANAFKLTEEEFVALDALNCELRTCDKEFGEFDY